MVKKNEYEFDEIIDGKKRLFSEQKVTPEKKPEKNPSNTIEFDEPVYVMDDTVSNREVDSVDMEKSCTKEELPPQTKEKERKRTVVIKEICLYIVLVVLCIYIVPNYVVQRTLVEGESMENSLYDGENVLVDKISYRFNEPERFDVVVFYPEEDDTEEYYVKRIIGMPGETVQIIDGDIYINGQILSEQYGKNTIVRAGIASQPIVLADDEYFVLGDNRLVSKDSRYSSVGPVDRKAIEGKVWVRIWPLDAFGVVK